MTALADLQSEARGVLGSLLPAGKPVALLDFPNHGNAGDSLLYLGERAYLRDLSVPVRYVAEIPSFDAAALRRRLGDDAPVLLHAGGNFGDRYGWYQQFREHVVATLRDRHIIQLPQSIEYADPDALARTQRVFATHDRLTLLFRDRPTADRAAALFPAAEVVFCPDVALGVGPVPEPAAPIADVVHVQRRDSEGAAGREVRLADTLSVVVTDWNHRRGSQLLCRALNLPESIGHRLPTARATLQPLTDRSYAAMAGLRVGRAVQILGQGRVVLTDRLHGMILGALMGKPVVALDNPNRKLSRIYDDYLHRLPNVRLARDATEAAELVEHAAAVAA